LYERLTVEAICRRKENERMRDGMRFREGLMSIYREEFVKDGA